MNRILLLFCALFVLGGCSKKLAERSATRATAAETRGDYITAAQNYITALERNPNQPDALARLREAGSLALGQYLVNAQREFRNGNAILAAEEFVKADALIAKSEAVRVNLPTSDEYNDTRFRVNKEAISLLRREADDAIAAKTFEKADELYGRILQFDNSVEQADLVAADRTQLNETWTTHLSDKAEEDERLGRWESASRLYQAALLRATPQQKAQVEDNYVRVMLNWSESEMREGRFRSAYQRAMDATKVLPNDRRAQEIREQAIERGTIKTLVLPLWRNAASAASMPTTFMDELNDELELEYWGQAPDFVRILDPRETRREMRRDNLLNRSLSDDSVIRFARRMGADMIIWGEIVRFNPTETREGSGRNITVRNRNGGNGSYVEDTYKYEINAVIEYNIIETRNGRSVQRETVEVREWARYKKALLPTDMRESDLELGRTQRAIFSGEDERNNREQLMEKVVNELSKRLERSVYDSVVRQLR